MPASAPFLTPRLDFITPAMPLFQVEFADSLIAMSLARRMKYASSSMTMRSGMIEYSLVVTGLLHSES